MLSVSFKTLLVEELGKHHHWFNTLVMQDSRLLRYRRP
jgi:hypothetical protein